MSPSQPPLSLKEFCDRHLPALERDEARHNLILAVLAGAIDGHSSDVMTWSLGAPGACAVISPGRFVVLADLDDAQCRWLAERTAQLDYAGVVGPDQTAPSFAGRAAELGVKFLTPMPQHILGLTGQPKFPGSPGHARRVTIDDVRLLTGWIAAFIREAAPFVPTPSPERVQFLARRGRHLLWIVDDQPVAMAAVVRQTRSAAAISMVYTPPMFRCRGYAGSATAAVVEQAFAEGKTTVCLYADLRNPYSNRCYTKIGFSAVCASCLIPRDMTERPAPPSPQ